MDAGSGTYSKSIVANVKYNEFGQMMEIARGNGTTTIYDYDIKGRLYGLITTTQSNNSGRRLQDTRYVFKTDHSIKSLENTPDIDSTGSNQSTIRYEYTYDGLNRLVHALGSYEKTRMGDNLELENKKFELGYAYAANGNLTGKTVFNPETHGRIDAWSYAYANHAVTSISTSRYGANRFQMTYDAAGNMTRQRDNEKALVKSMEYDSHNRIRKVTDPDKSKKNDIGEYWYDDGGFRVRKIAKTRIKNKDAKVEVLYPSMYSGMERQLKDNGNVINNTTYSVNNIYMNGVRIAALMENGKTRYYLTDQVDSVKVVVDDDGNAVTRMEYLPYGETWPLLAIRGIAALGHPVRRFQENKSGTEEEHNPKYNSQELDKETGYYFFNARHYNPEVGRFVTADNIIPYENETQSWNRFSYVRNNPIAYKDPTGHSDTTLSSDGDVKGISKTGDIDKQITGSFVKQNADIATNRGDALGGAVEQLSGYLDARNRKVSKDRAMSGTVQYSTDVVIKSIENMMSKRLDEYNKTGDKKLLNISSKDIVSEVMNTKVPEQMLVPQGGYGTGNFENGKTIKENIKNRGDSADIQAAEKNIKKLAESFVKGPEALKKYYEDSSGYYGQGINEKLKLFRMDSMSAVRKEQFEELKDQRERFGTKFNKD